MASLSSDIGRVYSEQDRASIMQPLNPYVAGNSVGGSPTFIGRGDILQNVYGILKNPQQNAILLHGQRRIGKTSILGELETQLQQEDIFCPVFFDLLGKAHQPVEQVITELANKICEVLGKEKPQLGDDPKTYFHEIWLPNLLKNEKNGLVLLFDEFDALDDDLAKQTRTEFFYYLRELVTINREKLNFVFVIGRNVGDLTQIALSLFKEIPTQKVSLLNQEDTFKLIALAESNEMLWPKKSKNKVWELTQGHPYLTQQVCYCVWEALHKDNITKTPKVSPKQIEQAIPIVLERSEGAINWLWGGLEAAQKVFISAVAEAGDKKKIVTQEQLNNLLSTIGIKISVPALADAPKSLQESWDLIKTDKNGYRFNVELLRHLVAKYKPLYKVKDTLNRLEPEANNYYQESLQLYEDKKLDEALDTLGRVLRLNPNHIEASQLQANILLEQGKLEEAANKLKKLFEDHPDEARPLLVQTLWNVAQFAKREGEQLKFYEEILQFYNNHIDAKKEIRKIWKRRAERALRVDDCKEAINAYQQAGLKDKVFEIKKKCFWDKYSKLIVQVIVFSVVLFLSYLANIIKLNIDIAWWLWGSGLGIIIALLVGKISIRKTRDEF
jgi:tetratricopeptide (TPR) repeat protein